MAVAIVLPLAVFSAVALALLLDSEREAARRSVRETTRLISQAIDEELSNAESALRVLSRAEALGRRDWAAFHERALAARTSDSAWIVLTDKDGNQIVNTRVAYGTRLPPRSNPGRVAQVLAEGKSSASDAYASALAQQLIVTLDVPVPAAMGGPYVLAQAFFPEHFNKAIAAVKAPPSWIVGLFDSKGITIARSHREPQFLGKPGNAEVIKALSERGSGELRHTTRDGVEVFDVFYRSPDFHWSVAVGMPVAELEAPAVRSVSIAAVGLLLALAAGGGLAYWQGRRLAGSVAQAAQAAGLLGRAGLPPGPKIRLDELDELHDALSAAHTALWSEKDGRVAAEADRAALYASEQSARALAEAQNRAKDDFLAMLGHELRNPLSAIQGAMAIIRLRGGVPSAMGKPVDVIERQARHLGDIVDDLLDVSRVMSGKIRLERRPVDLAAATHKVVATLQESGRMSQHRLELRLQEAWVDGDPTRLEQVITNLLVNAIKYTPDKGLISVAVEPRDGEAVLTVTDTGVGIPADLMPHIFETFVQGKPTIDRAQGGLGIGLSLVRRLMELHGGSVSAQSPGEGRGCVFTVRFPYIGKPPAAPAEEPAAASRAGALRVLVVDDHADSRTTLCEVLTLHGWHCRQAVDGLQGVEMATALPPDLAIVDIGLPGLNGYEVAARLRANPITSGIRLVALTGYGQDQDRRLALEAGFEAHLVKPASLDKLLQALKL